MKTYKVTLKSVSPIQFSRFYQTPKLEKESPRDYDLRTWKDKAHVNSNDFVIIPATFFKNSLFECAKYLGTKIPGKGKSTYTKHFKAGILVLDGINTGIKKENLEYVDVFGGTGGLGNARVLKRFPLVKKWAGTVGYLVLDEIITQEVITEHLIQCGKFQGLGTWRPINGGMYGRFKVESVVSG